MKTLGAKINQNNNKRKVILTLTVILVGLLLIFIGLVLSISYGAKSISFGNVLKNIFNNDINNIEAQIIRDIRLPRAIVGVIIGAALATSGTVMQGVTRNPIASPSIMGVTQGAAFAVAIYMALQPSTGSMGKVIFALIGASVSAIFVFCLSLNKSSVNITRMILAGTALSMLFISLASTIALLTNNSKNLAFWIAGGLSSSNWTSVKILLVMGIVGFTLAIILSPKITILSLGDEVAIGLGENPNLIRMLSLIIVVILSGTAAAIGGNIGFVCLIVPQIAKMCVGSDYRFLMPVSLIFGSVLVVYSDILARVLASPFEVPLGSITSLIGVPILIYLVRKGGR